MKSNYSNYLIPQDITDDYLSSFIKGFTFVPHRFGHQCNDITAVCDFRVIGDFELIYFVDGEGYITVGENEYICNKGDLVLITPFLKHKIQTSAQKLHDNYWIHFDIYPFYRHKDFISAIMQESCNKIHIGDSQELMILYKYLENERSVKRPGGRILCETILTQIITLILRTEAGGTLHEGIKSYKGKPEEEIVNKTLEFIQNNINGRINVEDLCDNLHISESYLFKSFAKIMKMSPNNFIQMYKIKKAEQIMKTSAYSFKEISETLGFSSQYYFCNVFKKYYKMSPREYMKIFNDLNL
jgi:AraC-like DNA-binding protein